MDYLKERMRDAISKQDTFAIQILYTRLRLFMTDDEIECEFINVTELN